MRHIQYTTTPLWLKMSAPKCFTDRPSRKSEFSIIWRITSNTLENYDYNSVITNNKHLPGETNHINMHFSCGVFEFIFNTIILGCCCVFGVIGNSISFFMLYNISMNSIVIFILQVLAVADNCVLLLALLDPAISEGLPIHVLGEERHNSLSAISVVYLRPLIFTATTASVWITVILAINRYIAVCKPLRARHLCTKKKTNTQLALVLVFSCLGNIPRFFQFRLETQTESAIEYYVAAPTIIGIKSTFNLIYDGIIYNIIVILIPLLFLIYANVNIVLQLRKTRQQNAQQLALQPGHRPAADESVDTLMVVIILIVIICQLPNRIFRMTLTFIDDASYICPNGLSFFDKIATFLVALNSSINFVVYIWLNKRFRKQVKKVCRCSK